MGQKLASMLCLLLGLSLSHIALAQSPSVGDPMFGIQYDVIMVRKHLATARPNGKIQMNCRVSSPGRFKAWVKDNFVVGVTPTLELDADGPNVFGIYYCIADPAVSPNRYRALQFVITDMPPSDKTSEVSVATNQDISLTCKLTSSTGVYKWYRYNDLNYRFEEMSGQTGKQLALSYTSLNREHGMGFTYYKCIDPSNPSVYHAFKAVKDPTREMIDGRMTNVYEHSMRGVPTGVATIPISVTPKSKVTFECHKVTPSDSTQWYFRGNNTMSPANYNEMGGTGGVEIQDNPDSSVLSVKNCDVRNKGYYRCNVGGVVKYAFLDIRVIVPTIHEYGKGIYDLQGQAGDENELECEIPIGGEVKDVVWRVVPSDGSRSYDIPVNENMNGFETSIKDSGTNQLVTVKFRDNSRFHNYRLECRLGDELDYVTLRSEPPIELKITIGPSKFPSYKLVNCTYDLRLTEIKFHKNKDKNELPIGSPQNAHSRTPPISGYFYKTTVENEWFRCSGKDPKGNRVYSDPVPLFKDPLMLDIKIDGTPAPRGSQPAIAKVEGQRTEFSCNFTNYKDIGISAENVKLVFEGRMLPNRPIQTSPGMYQFVFDNPRPSMSGKYSCIHSVSTPGQRVRSSEVTINWCETNQFMCDNRCRDKSIVCNGVRDCADGSDEHPALCSPCEPNEVPCQDWKGIRAARNCVLKHWLCDGTDDCENGYDEESPLSKEWCTNTCIDKPWSNCPSNSTCCKSGKCILRAYECDKENDCGGNEDESACCSLNLIDPTRRQVVQQREGTRVTLTCKAVGSERPTINWRCNWGQLRDDKRMKESNRVVRQNPDSTYEVEGVLVIENFTKADECIYNCEAVTKCKRQMSPEFDVKVGVGEDCSKTCGIGGICQNNVCNCKINVEGPNCDRCKRGYHSLNKDHPDGCVPCFCSGRSNVCENAGLYFEEKSVSPIERSNVRLMGWGLYGVYEESTSHEKVSVTSGPAGPEITVSSNGDTSGVPKDDDESYVFLTSLEGKRLASYGGKISFTARVTVPMGGSLEPYTTFPVFGIKGWRGRTLVYWDHTTRRAPETRYSVTLDEQNLRAIDGSPVSRDDVMTALTDLRGIFFRVYHFLRQGNTVIQDVKYEEATAASGASPAPVERCTICPDPYQGAFCEECKTSGGDFHRIIDYNSTINRWKCVPCREGYKNSPSCNVCEEGYADKILGRPSGARPDCEEYVVPIVEPETLDVPSGRTVVFTCRVRRQKPGYNGTAWLLEWQSADGARISDSPRVFQVRSEASARLVIRDASPADAGRYRCEGYNRRSGSAFAFANLTVPSRSVKKVMLRTVPQDPDTTTVQCSVIAKEPARPNQFRATLTRLPFPVNRESEDFETVKSQVSGVNFTGRAVYKMKNDDDSGFWTCHVSDLFTNYTVSRRTPVVLKPQQSFNWDLNTPVSKIEEPVGSVVRLKCNKVIRSPNQVTIPIDWSFVPANSKASSLFSNPLGSREQKRYSTMDEKVADSLPPGASRDGDDLVLNPLSVEHWGTFSCQRQPETRSAISSRSNTMSVPESYKSKQASVEVVPTLIGSRNINLEEGSSVTFFCLPNTKNLDDDGLPCHKYSWVYKSQKSAKQLLGRHGSVKMLQLFGENKPTFTINNAKHVDSGMYYCRCHTFYRPGSDIQFSKVMEYNVFVSVLEDVPPSPKYIAKERVFVDKKPQWLYCYDETARPPAKTWWEVWSEPATSVPGVTLAGEGKEGNRSYSNITFIMDKHVHQVFFTCNAENDVSHKTIIVNMRFASSDYDPLRLKIIISTTYGLLHKVQSDDHAVVDKAHVPMDQFNLTGEGYRDNMIIMCHMIGNPYGYDLELVHDDPTSPSDVPNLIRKCSGMISVANVAYCNISRYWDYVNYKWQCRAKQEHPDTKNVTTYAKNLEFVKVPSKVKIRFHYHKWYDYDERNLKFNMLRGGVAVIRCDASYYQNGKLTEIPFPYEYKFYIHGQEGLPHFAKQTGNILSITDIPESLDKKEIMCFVKPQNKSQLATYGLGQRYFTVSVFTMPEKPSILVTMQDATDKSLIIRNPTIVDLRRGGDPIELTCTLNNYDPKVDKSSGDVRYLDWVKCKNDLCNYAEAEAGTETSVSSMEKKLEGDKATLKVQTSSVKNSGIFMCVAVRPFVNVTGGKDMQLKSIPVKALVLTKPGEGDDSRTFGMMTVQRTASGDIEFDCFFVGYPFPDLEINRFDIDNKDVKLENPKWVRQYEGAYFDDKDSFRYGSQLKYKLPKENIGADAAKGTYVCSAENSLGKAETERSWDG